MFRKLRHGLRFIFGLFMIVGLIFAIEMVTAFVVTVFAAKNGKSLSAGRLPEKRLLEDRLLENRLVDGKIDVEIPLQT